jgi:hypothetical protein
MESFANQIQFDLLVEILIEPNRFRLQNCKVVVLERDLQELLAW